MDNTKAGFTQAQVSANFFINCSFAQCFILLVKIKLTQNRLKIGLVSSQLNLLLKFCILTMTEQIWFKRD